ncbi:hypothetical protein CRG98_001192 [Punica granatum]|uniref:Uncharacterized protein n=1 Tax=Punica granatum TaxID=22663 RepID=A0A2I0LCL6_PUNGR|nr:hypothetical protein CRG98_001192 [Punica granatum]
MPWSGWETLIAVVWVQTRMQWSGCETLIAVVWVRNPNTVERCQSDQRHAQARFGGIPLKPGHPRSLTDAFSDRTPGTRSTDKQMASQNGPTGTQEPLGSGNKLQMTFQNSTWSPEGRFSGHKRLPASLRGMFVTNRDHSDPRTPRDIRKTLRKPQS